MEINRFYVTVLHVTKHKNKFIRKMFLWLLRESVWTVFKQISNNFAEEIFGSNKALSFFVIGRSMIIVFPKC